MIVGQTNQIIMLKSLKGWVVILFTIAFNFFFWKEKFGLNIVLLLLLEKTVFTVRPKTNLQERF